jgi:hypothetical protein
MKMNARHRRIAVKTVLLLLIAVPLSMITMIAGRHFGRLSRAASRKVSPQTPMPPLSPEDQWLRDHYPSLLNVAQLKSLYKSLIEGYWVPQTGLFLSFPRTGDLRLVQQAATYDQGVIGILLLKLGDLKKVGKILAFYETAWAGAAERSGPRQGVYGLSNFYNSYFSVEGVEKTMHVGPNAWIGLLASRYWRRTGDPQARDLALGIAHWMIEKVPHTDGAIAMGQIPWNGAPWDHIYSTENNLSTYAFLGDLLKAKDLAPADRRLIKEEREGIGKWLIEKAYQPQSKTVLRGFHLYGLDRAGAIDSYTWFLSSLRPDVLRAKGIPTDDLIRHAEKDFTVKLDGRPGIDAVDEMMAEATYKDAVKTHYTDLNFLRPADGNHRLIWYEGQGQFIVALQDVARDAVHHAFLTPEGPQRAALLNQASGWLEEARIYTKAMDQAAIHLSWGTGYPCATTGRFYLYGWPAPQPLEGHLADASAPLVWRLFAGMGYEPLTDTDLAVHAATHVKALAWRSVRDPGTAILYGASEEMMVQAWKLYDRGEKDAAWRQAKATINLWEEDAKKLEKAKEENFGGYLPFDESIASFQRIHNFWALNDVASCYFILGKIEDEAGHVSEAKDYFSTILHELPLAQMWDKRGWFWNPVQTIQTEYVEARPNDYGSLAAEVPYFPAFLEGTSAQTQANASAAAAPNPTVALTPAKTLF